VIHQAVAERYPEVYDTAVRATTAEAINHRSPALVR
jgi:hypothetical protein